MEGRGEPAGTRTQDQRLKRALFPLLHRSARYCRKLKISSIHAAFTSSISAEPLRRIARNSAFVYHICITADRAEDKANSPGTTFACGRTPACARTPPPGCDTGV